MFLSQSEVCLHAVCFLQIGGIVQLVERKASERKLVAADLIPLLEMCKIVSLKISATCCFHEKRPSENSRCSQFLKDFRGVFSYGLP